MLLLNAALMSRLKILVKYCVRFSRDVCFLHQNDRFSVWGGTT